MTKDFLRLEIFDSGVFWVRKFGNYWWLDLRWLTTVFGSKLCTFSNWNIFSN